MTVFIPFSPSSNVPPDVTTVHRTAYAIEINRPYFTQSPPIGAVAAATSRRFEPRIARFVSIVRCEPGFPAPNSRPAISRVASQLLRQLFDLSHKI
jgi:hypothetical protein